MGGGSEPGNEESSSAAGNGENQTVTPSSDTAGTDDNQEGQGEVQASQYQTTYGSKMFDNVTITLLLCASCPHISGRGAAVSIMKRLAALHYPFTEPTITPLTKYFCSQGKMFDNVTITVELFDRSNAPEGSTITENKWTEYVNQEMNKVGINVEFVPVPRWDEITKMQSMVAGQTAPDLTLTYTYAYAEDYFNQGGIWDLTEFIDGPDQALNMKEYLGQEVLDIGRNPDGKLYGIVAKRATTAKDNICIRKDWLDDLGLSVPTTPDELYNAIEPKSSAGNLSLRPHYRLQRTQSRLPNR